MFTYVFKGISIIVFINGIKKFYLCGPKALFNPSVLGKFHLKKPKQTPQNNNTTPTPPPPQSPNQNPNIVH